MLNFKTRDLKGNAIYYDSQYGQRWLDAVGPGVMVFDAAKNPTTAIYTTTAVSAGTGTSTLACRNGGLYIVTAGNENDGINAQLTGGGFYCSSSVEWYFGIEIAISTATQSDLLVGMCITDTTLLAGMTDGVYIHCVDGSTTINAKNEKDSTNESETDTGTAMTTAAHWYEIHWNGSSLMYYVDGALAVTHSTAANIPDNEPLTPSIHYLNGAAAAGSATITDYRAIQIKA